MTLSLLLAGDTSPVSLAGTPRYWFLRTPAMLELQSEVHLWSNLVQAHTCLSKSALRSLKYFNTFLDLGFSEA